MLALKTGAKDICSEVLAKNNFERNIWKLFFSENIWAIAATDELDLCLGIINTSKKICALFDEDLQKVIALQLFVADRKTEIFQVP